MKIGAIQLCSVLDYKTNLEKIREFLKEAKSLKVSHVFLPEVFYSMSDGIKRTPYLVKKNNEHYENILNLAKEFEVYLLAGSAATDADDSKRAFNRAYNFSPKGEDLGFYDKMNLFSCELEKDGKKKVIDEAEIYIKGHTPKMIKAGSLNVGLSICFDLRFPEIYKNYVLEGANLLTVPAAFTRPTGQAHWHTLIRARAIECQCYVVAPAQWGDHNERISTYGHSLIVDPWGEVLADAGEGEKLITAEINLDRIEEVRKSVKVGF